MPEPPRVLWDLIRAHVYAALPRAVAEAYLRSRGIPVEAPVHREEGKAE